MDQDQTKMERVHELTKKCTDKIKLLTEENKRLRNELKELQLYCRKKIRHHIKKK